MSVRGIAAAALLLAAMVGYLLVATPDYPHGYHVPEAKVDWTRGAEVEATGDVLDLSWLGGAHAGGQPDGFIEHTLEQRFNIRLEPIFLGNDAYSRRKPLMMMGGQVPDVIREYDPIVLQRDAYHGFLLPIPYDVILKYAPTYVRHVNETGPVSWLYAYWNGRNYGLPTTYYSGMFPVPGLWRADWLRRVGIDKVPETLEEMHEALRRFRYDDPDGNGEQDTYGLTGDLTRWWWASFGDVFGAFGVAPYDWMRRDGKAVWGGILPETRDALAVLRSWYAEGLIHPDVGTDSYDGSQGGMDRKFINGRVGYYYYQARFASLRLDLPASLYSRLKALHPDAELVAGKFPIGPTGRRGARVWGGGGHVIAFGRHLAQSPEKVIRILRMLERICRNAPEDATEDGELYIIPRLGRRGEHWDFVDQQQNPYAVWDFLGEYRDRNKQKRAVLGGLMDSFFCPGVAVPQIADRYTPAAELEFRRQHRPGELALVDLLGKPDVVPSAGQRMKDLRNLQMTAFAEIILGERPLDYFETFRDAWLAQGGAQMTREANELVAAMAEIYERVGVEAGATAAPRRKQEAPTGARSPSPSPAGRMP